MPSCIDLITTKRQTCGTLILPDLSILRIPKATTWPSYYAFFNIDNPLDTNIFLKPLSAKHTVSGLSVTTARSQIANIAEYWSERLYHAHLLGSNSVVPGLFC